MNTLNIKHLTQIISGFVIGQGAFFLSQTYMVYNNELNLVGQLGIGLGLLSLAQWFSDCGGVFLTSTKLNAADKYQELQHFFVARFIVVITLCTACYLAGLVLLFEGLVREIFSWFIVVSVISSFNITGYLDHERITRITGPLSGLCWLLPSILIFFHKSLSPWIGELVGAAYALGLLISTLTQHQQAKLFNKLSPFHANPEKIKENIIEIIKYNSMFVTSQLYARLIPVLVSSSVNMSIAGMYLYAKSIANIINQGVSFSRRTEFSSLTQLQNKKISITELMKKQKLSLMIATAPAALSVLATTIINTFYDNKNSELLTTISALLTINLAWIIASSLAQFILAQSRIGILLITQISTISISLLFMLLLIKDFGISAVLFAETIMYIIQIYLYSTILKKQ